MSEPEGTTNGRAPSSSEGGRRKKITLTTLYERKAAREPMTWLTAYDYPTALLMDHAGVEMILVGDSVGMTVLGYETTLPVTMEEMLIFTSAVCRAVDYAFVIGSGTSPSAPASTDGERHRAESGPTSSVRPRSALSTNYRNQGPRSQPPRIATGRRKARK